MFILHRGKTKMMFFKKGDTTHELRDGGLVSIDDSGNLVPPKNDSTDRVVGVCRANVSMTDTAYNPIGANSTPGFVPVEVPVENYVEWMIDVDSDGGAADSDIGRYCAVDTTGGNSVNTGDSAGTRVDISDTAVRQVYIVGRQSATRIRGVIARLAGNAAGPDTAAAL